MFQKQIAISLMVLFSFAVKAQDVPIEVISDQAEFDQKNQCAKHMGHVQIIQGKHELYADSVQIFKNGSTLSRIIAHGNPARCKIPQNKTSDSIECEANQITWDIQQQRLSLEGDAELIKDKNSMHSGKIEYDFNSKNIHASSDSHGQRTRLVIESHVLQSNLSSEAN